MTVELPRQFGIPISLDYGFETQFNLLRSQMASGWSRQRRTWLHNPSILNLTYRLTIESAGEMVKWLRLNAGEIRLTLLHANDISSEYDVEGIIVQRKTDVVVERIPFVNQVYVRFSVETKFRANYELNASSARGPQDIEYPKYLPLPSATGFTESHKENGRVEYQMQFSMNTRTLVMFLEFAGAKGLRWFKMHWPAARIGCGEEYIRFISDPSKQLVSPNQWVVSLAAEGMPVFLTQGAPEISYDQPDVNYDDDYQYNGQPMRALQ